MKANEAPEKLYFDVNNNLIGLYDSAILGMFSEKNTETVIEYIRADAFIDKALAYLNDKFYFNNLHYAVENNTFNCMEEMFEDFVKYMEGE